MSMFTVVTLYNENVNLLSQLMEALQAKFQGELFFALWEDNDEAVTVKMKLNGHTGIELERVDAYTEGYLDALTERSKK